MLQLSTQMAILMHSRTKSDLKGYTPIKTTWLMYMQVEKLNATMLCHARLTPDRF